jgi:adenosyl cobinamide kinase/adenosyl cobinamide phosphate guanylyltransferase
MRRLHLVDKHQYPKYFPFDLVATGTLSFEQKKKRDQKNRERIKKHNEKHGQTPNQKQPQKKKKQKQEQKKKQQDPEDVDMIDELTSSMSKLKIPKSISFGYRKAPTLPQSSRNHYKQDTTDIIMAEETRKPPRKRGPKKKKNEIMDFI